MKYAEYLLSELASKEKYTHCYFVAGGNTMHLLDSARKIFKCIPVVNEVAAGIAAEYFNESNLNGDKAFALVTAGPGLTNVVTAIAGAYLESRELLVIGGQVKIADLKSPGLRQRGIQEIDGRSIVEPITIASISFLEQKPFSDIQKLLHASERPGPVFLEIPLDIQSSEFTSIDDVEPNGEILVKENFKDHFLESIINDLENCSRPVILLGGGLSRNFTRSVISDLENLGIPIMTTWNGMDRYGAELSNYWGRPNTWGQRSSNILIQQCDLLIAIGTRLGLQQTGFAWQDFAPLAKIFQVDIDSSELEKGHPKIKTGLKMDADAFLSKLLLSLTGRALDYSEWLSFGETVMSAFPLNEKANLTRENFVSPYQFMEVLSNKLEVKDVIIPCSSGGAFTVTMQAFSPKFGQIIITNKGLASMGYGLSGAIGAAESTQCRTILIEGDGGFAQNLQELGTVAAQNLNVKIFIFSNSGYASIRMTQKNYFAGAYLGCDVETGLGLPNWELISDAYGISYTILDNSDDIESVLGSVLETRQPEVIEVKIDPDQTYFPKITSRILPSGEMVSQPLHLMTPDLTLDEIKRYLPYLLDRLM